MSIEWMNRVWEIDMPSNEKIVLLAYADHARADGTCIFPSIGLVARKTEYSEREVQRITRRLSRYLIPDGTGPRGTRRWRLQIPGELEVRAGKSGKTPEHRETASASAAIPETERSPRSTAEGVTPKASVSGERSPWAAVGATPGTGGGDKHTDETVTRVSPESSLTMIEPSTRGELAGGEIQKDHSKAITMLGSTAHLAYENRDKIPDRYQAYADTFHALTGLAPTDRVLADWLSTFGVWEAEGIGEKHIRQAIEAARGHYSVLRPRSVTDTAAALSAKARVSKARGKTSGWTPGSMAEFQFRLDRSRRVQAEWYMSRGMGFEDPDTMRPRVAAIPARLASEPEEHLGRHAVGDVRAKIGELVSRLGSHEA